MTYEFRAKRISDGQWVYGYHTVATEGKRGFHKDWIISKVQANGGFFSVMQRYAVDPTTLDRNTGLVDKLGNEIYENDVCGVVSDVGILIHSFVIKWGVCGGVRPRNWTPFRKVPYGYEGWYVIGYDKDTVKDFRAGFRNDIHFWLPKLQVIGNIHNGDEQEMLKTRVFRKVKVTPYYVDPERDRVGRRPKKK